MKTLLFALVCLVSTASAQKIALLDRSFKRPLEFTDSATLEQMVQGYFPIYVQDIEPVLRQTEWFIRYFDSARPASLGSQDFKTGSSTFIFQSPDPKNNYRNQIVLSTLATGLETSIILVAKEDTNKRSMQRLRIFIDYLRNNISVAGAETSHASLR